MSDLKINIHGRNDNNTIVDKEYPKFEDAANRLKPMGGSRASKDVRIVFEPSAVSVLFENIRWGRKYERGDVEQAGMLLGNYYRDTSENPEIIWGDVLAVVPADPELVNASFEAIDITAAAWQKMHEEAAVHRAENLQILGWYHTHLSHINTRFSSVDTRTQRKAFTYEYSFGVVFNPNQKKWSAFYGSDSKECVGELILDEALEAKYGEPKIKIVQVSGDSELKEDGTVVHLDEEGRPIQQVNHQQPVVSQVSQRTSSSGESSSLGQIVRHSLVKLGQWLSTPKKTSATYTSANNNVNPHSNNRESKRGDKPKIQLGQVNRRETAILCRYYSLSSNNEMVEQPNFECKIRDGDIKAIIQYKRKRASERTTENMVLWGQIRNIGTVMELITVPEQRANAKIIFTSNTLDDNNTQLVGMGQQRVSNMDSKAFIIFINDSCPEKVEVRIMHFSRGNVI